MQAAEIEGVAKERYLIVGPAVGGCCTSMRGLLARRLCPRWPAAGYLTMVGDGGGRRGKAHYTDGSRKNADEARGYLSVRVLPAAQIHVGDALEVLSERTEQFDLLFCDIDKPDYPRAARMAPNRVRRGGLFITDNTLWRGDVAYAAGNPDFKPEAQPDETVRAIVEFNELLYQSPDWYTTIIPP
jgi:predicted O-methyltransferase YrrM